MTIDQHGRGTMSSPDPTPATECADMREIRGEIDRIDRAIIALLGERFGYVHEAAKFKTSETSVRALDRVASMLEDRERWATEVGISPRMIRELYQNLIDYFTDHELREWSQRS